MHQGRPYWYNSETEKSTWDNPFAHETPISQSRIDSSTATNGQASASTETEKVRSQRVQQRSGLWRRPSRVSSDRSATDVVVANKVTPAQTIKTIPVQQQQASPGMEHPTATTGDSSSAVPSIDYSTTNMNNNGNNGNNNNGSEELQTMQLQLNLAMRQHRELRDLLFALEHEKNDALDELLNINSNYDKLKSDVEGKNIEIEDLKQSKIEDAIGMESQAKEHKVEIEELTAEISSLETQVMRYSEEKLAALKHHNSLGGIVQSLFSLVTGTISSSPISETSDKEKDILGYQQRLNEIRLRSNAKIKSFSKKISKLKKNISKLEHLLNRKELHIETLTSELSLKEEEVSNHIEMLQRKEDEVYQMKIALLMLRRNLDDQLDQAVSQRDALSMYLEIIVSEKDEEVNQYKDTITDLKEENAIYRQNVERLEEINTLMVDQVESLSLIEQREEKQSMHIREKEETITELKAMHQQLQNQLIQAQQEVHQLQQQLHATRQQQQQQSAPKLPPHLR